MTENEPSKKPTNLGAEMAAEAIPLSSAEKKLIGWSLGLGITLLVGLVLLTGAWRF